MKITKKQLMKIIKEEMSNLLESSPEAQRIINKRLHGDDNKYGDKSPADYRAGKAQQVRNRRAHGPDHPYGEKSPADYRADKASAIRKKRSREAVTEDETMQDYPINAVGFLPDDILDTKIQQWLDDLRGPAIEAAEAGDRSAKKFLARIEDVGATAIKNGLMQAMGLGRSRGKDQSLARSFEKDFYSDEEAEA